MTSNVAPTCVVCGTSDTKLLLIAQDYRRPQDTEIFKVYWCTLCQCGSVAGQFSPPAVARFYDIEYYTHSAAATLRKPSNNLLQTVLMKTANYFDHGSTFSPHEFGEPGSVIDVGCGGGDNMKKARDAGFFVTGVEPDPKARLNARQFGPVFSGTAEDLPHGLRSDYDYALMSHVLEHTISPRIALAQIRARLKDGGKIIIEVPNCNSAGFGTFGSYWPWTDIPRHLHFFTRASLENLLHSAGFSVLTCVYVGYTRQFQSSWINDMAAIHEVLSGARFGRIYWGKEVSKLLLRTALATPERKYDSMRLKAVKVGVN